MTSVTTTRGLMGALALAATLLGLPFAAAQEEVAGAKDHPFLTRLPFAWIQHYSQEEKGSYPLVLSALPSDDAGPEDAKQAQTLQGRVTRIQYRIESGMSASTAYHQYGYKLTRGKDDTVETLVERKGPPTRAPGGSVWLRKVFAPLGEEAVEGLATSVAPGQRRFYAGRQVSDAGAEIYVVLVVNQHADSDVRIQLDIIEP